MISHAKKWGFEVSMVWACDIGQLALWSTSREHITVITMQSFSNNYLEILNMVWVCLVNMDVDTPGFIVLFNKVNVWGGMFCIQYIHPSVSTYIQSELLLNCIHIFHYLVIISLYQWIKQLYFPIFCHSRCPIFLYRMVLQLSSWLVKRVMRRWWDYYYSQEHSICQITWETWV